MEGEGYRDIVHKMSLLSDKKAITHLSIINLVLTLAHRVRFWQFSCKALDIKGTENSTKKYCLLYLEYDWNDLVVAVFLFRVNYLIIYRCNKKEMQCTIKKMKG